jgi:hypothetical protein
MTIKKTPVRENGFSDESLRVLMNQLLLCEKIAKRSIPKPVRTTLVRLIGS